MSCQGDPFAPVCPGVYTDVYAHTYNDLTNVVGAETV